MDYEGKLATLAKVCERIPGDTMGDAFLVAGVTGNQIYSLVAGKPDTATSLYAMTLLVGAFRSVLEIVKFDSGVSTKKALQSLIGALIDVYSMGGFDGDPGTQEGYIPAARAKAAADAEAAEKNGASVIDITEILNRMKRDAPKASE